MSKELTLEEIHEELLCQLRDITAVCERHGIEYNLMCGTLLGSVRHRGFIPWSRCRCSRCIVLRIPFGGSGSRIKKSVKAAAFSGSRFMTRGVQVSR